MRTKDSKFSLNYQMSQNFLKRPPQLPPPLKNRRMFSQKFQHLYPHLHPNLHLSSLVLHLNFNRQLKRKETTKKNWMTPPLKKVSCSSFVKVRISKCHFSVFKSTSYWYLMMYIIFFINSVHSDKVHKFLKSEAKDEKTTNIKFSFKVKFDSDQAALNMKKAINKAYFTGVKANTDSNEN